MCDYGMPTLIEISDIASAAALCRELGLQFIELNMNMPMYQADAIDLPFYRAIAERYGIYYTLHLEEDLDVCSFNQRVSEAWRLNVMDAIAVAIQLESPIINMHLSQGVYFTMPSEKVYLYDAYNDKYMKSIEYFRDECTRATGGSCVKICIENTNGFTRANRYAIDALLISDTFGLTLDIGHNHGANGVDEAFIMQRSNRLWHYHVHDAQGRRDHIALGEGEVDLLKYLSLTDKVSGRKVIETKTIESLVKSAEWLKLKNIIR